MSFCWTKIIEWHTTLGNTDDIVIKFIYIYICGRRCDRISKHNDINSLITCKQHILSEQHIILSSPHHSVALRKSILPHIVIIIIIGPRKTNEKPYHAYRTGRHHYRYCLMDGCLLCGIKMSFNFEWWA